MKICITVYQIKATNLYITASCNVAQHVVFFENFAVAPQSVGDLHDIFRPFQGHSLALWWLCFSFALGLVCVRPIFVWRLNKQYIDKSFPKRNLQTKKEQSHMSIKTSKPGKQQKCFEHSIFISCSLTFAPILPQVSRRIIPRNGVCQRNIVVMLCTSVVSRSFNSWTMGIAVILPGSLTVCPWN